MSGLDRGGVLLGVGTAAGLVLAAVGLLTSGRAASSPLPEDVVARVNGVPIRADDYRRTLDAVAQDRREPPDEALRRHVLDRLIDEELLVQRGLELGLARVDPRVRRELAAGVTAAAVAGADAREPSAAELAAFHAEEGAFFARGGRLHVAQVFVAADAPDGEDRARRAAGRLRSGEPLARVRDELGDPEAAPLPAGPVPLAKLADYLGPTPLRAAVALPPGAVGDPVRSDAGWHVLIVIARDGAVVPPLAEIEPQVRAEWRRRTDERTLRAALAELRARADVAVAGRP